MVGIKLQCLLELLDRFVGMAFARRQQAEIVPCVRERAGIALRKLYDALEGSERFGRFVLLQVDATQTVERFGYRFSDE